MTTNPGQDNKYSISIGQVTGGEIQVGDRSYYKNAEAKQASTAPITNLEESLAKRTILFLASSPINQARLRLDAEIREIDQGLRLGQRRDQFALKQCWAVRPDNLRRSLLDECPQILHFSGHGEGTKGLVLEDNLGLAQTVSTEALVGLFKLFASRGLECVVLNACYSEVQAEAIAQHIPCVVGMNSMVSDTAAIKFAVGFYDALASGWTYTDAYALGCNAIALEGISQDLIPKLKTHNQEVHPLSINKIFGFLA
jgi:hypothetical protein